jgi:5-methylcytosine-specific restriction endonuclease McrA
MKNCGKCKELLPLDAFAKNRARTDGLQGYCKACDRIKNKEYASKNKDKQLVRTNKWRENNRDQYLSLKREWRKRQVALGTLKKYPKDSEKHRLRMIERRAKLANNGVFVLLPKEERKLMRGPCFYCQATEKITIDHIIPIYKGGRHSIGNLVSACKSCNSSKGVKFLVVWKRNIERK